MTTRRRPHRRGSGPGLLEQGLAVGIVFLYTGALVPIVRGGGSVEGDPLMQAVFFASYLAAFVMIVLHWERALRALSRDTLLWLPVGFAVLSVLWSTTPSLTLRSSIALVGTTVVGVYFASRFDLRRQLHLIGIALGLATILSLVFAIAMPGQAIASSGEWRGIFVNKNALGRMMVLSALVFYLLSVMMESRMRWLARSGLILAVGLMVLSTSKTALVVFVALALMLQFRRPLQWHYSLALPFLVCALSAGILVTVWVAANTEPILGALGKDVTLTGRTELWSTVWTMIGDRFWLGYGYSGFWLGWDGPSAYVWWVTGWMPPHAHMGYLDLWLDLGLVGLVLFLATYIRTFLRALVFARILKVPEGLWPLMYLMFVLLYNNTESIFLVRNNIFWLLYVTASLSIFRYRVRRVPAFVTGSRAPLPVGTT